MTQFQDAHSRHDAAKVRRHRQRFEQFITDRGGEVLAPTNQWELVRFKTSTATAIIYCNQRGEASFHGGAKTAFDAYLRGSSWTAGNKRKRKKGGQGVVILSLIRRDGPHCFYCGCDASGHLASVEHVVPLNAGGTDHMANKVLACKPCNMEAGHLPVIEKIKLRERKRGGRDG